MRKGGQTAIFIIVAIVIVVGTILVYAFYPELSSFVGGEISAASYMQECLEPEIKPNVELIASQGGYANPEGFILHGGDKVKYLCYTAHYFVPCEGGIQQPMLKNKFEKELAEVMQQKAENCATDLRQQFLRRGYSISEALEVRTAVRLAPEKIIVSVNAPMTVQKETTQTFREFTFEVPSKMYDLVMTSMSIVDYESTYGDAATDIYIQYYPNLRITKTKLGDGSTVYELEDVTTQEKFKFASRSLVFAPGYGLA